MKNSVDPIRGAQSKAVVLIARGVVRTMLVVLISISAIVIINTVDIFSLFSAAPVTMNKTSKSSEVKSMSTPQGSEGYEKNNFWFAPDIEEVTDQQILFGRELIMHTSKYLGPEGKISKLSNGMNCQNCHLEAGTKIFGNNYSAVASTYPKMRPRSGKIESIEKRVRDCFERSLNGQSPSDTSKEMQAIVAYIKWLGSEVPKGEKPEGSGLKELAYLDRPASPENGKIVYSQTCALCHGTNGEGLPNPNFGENDYPALWGSHSFNTGAGLFRLSRLAAYVHSNMPFGVSHENPTLTCEEAWDVAAFINSQARPGMDISKDWRDISKKPVDHPFGPFADSFSEEQHKFGPFGAIKSAADGKK